jgi:glycosyltransferase involved in cell wall biosynthesis
VKHTWNILVVGNYSADNQQSMIRFAELLVRIYRAQAQVQLIRPPVLVTRLPGLPPVARKYLAYIDKLLFFPPWLALRAGSYDRIHIADHSNAFYAFCCSPKRCLITCHDLLAVRGAMGDSTAACNASAFGLWLQRLIMAGLRRAGAIAFDSQATYYDFLRLGGGPPSQRHAVIPIPLNAPFTADAEAFHLSEAELALLPTVPYLLMVGSALPRKNRALALQLLERLGKSSPFRLVLAGEPLAPAEQVFRDTHPLGDRLLSITLPSHALLNRLYCQAHALLFPSLAEGFGWPLLEAQTCRCPVIASATTSIPEVAGDGALYANPTDVDTFAAHVRTLEDPAARAHLIDRGIANLQRYDHEKVGDEYRLFAIQHCSSTLSPS